MSQIPKVGWTFLSDYLEQTGMSILLFVFFHCEIDITISVIFAFSCKKKFYFQLDARHRCNGRSEINIHKKNLKKINYYLEITRISFIIIDYY